MRARRSRGAGRAGARRARLLVAIVASLLPVALCAADGSQHPEAATGRVEKRAVVASRQMVVAAHPLAADAGIEILRAGGSALDAALAVQLVLGLVEPQSSGIGGGAFLLHWSARERRLRSYDGRETAPAAAREDRFLAADGRPLDFFDAVVSGRSVGVPGVLRMFELAHREHGRLPWAALFAPALRLAAEGFPVSPRLHRLLEADRFLRDDPRARVLYYRAADGVARPAAHAVGMRLRNPGYAEVLREVAARGARAFYEGAIAADIVHAVRAHKRPGDLAREDLARYRALERAPLCGAYRTQRLCGAGPPSAGVITVLQILGILEHTGFAREAAGSVEAVHLFSEAARLAYADRARYVADPAYVPVPVPGLLAADYLQARSRLVGERSMGMAAPGQPVGATSGALVPESESAGTTHVSIVDTFGDAVALTSSIEHAFGSRIVVRGFLLNNQLTDFAFQPGREALRAANRVQPGKRPRSGMAPMMVFGTDGAPVLIIGSPGGTPIAAYVAKTLVGILDWGLDAQGATALPNFGSTNGPTLIEQGADGARLAAGLAARGHAVELAPLTSGVHAIERLFPANRGPDQMRWRGGADPRREGVVRAD